MSSEVARSRLAGVRYGRLSRIVDRRGSFTELWRASTFGDLGPEAAGLPDAHFVQANLSTSAPGVLRGLHYHRRQLDHWTVVAGRALVALVDVRPVAADPAARAVVETRELGEGETVTIPTGVGHGFLALEPLSLLYLVTNEYDGSDELGFAWDDPAVGVPWPAIPGTPDGQPILSDRDRANPTLHELVESLRGG
ncbi:MAG: dTDP-4-dehydrorhamnose 3,5-epimerase family protein [Candidatus Limnocylindrales bacterium]|jgi:dTDP-4-dehydrorhamnose 3,5-epimerase